MHDLQMVIKYEFGVIFISACLQNIRIVIEGLLHLKSIQYPNDPLVCAILIEIEVEPTSYPLKVISH